ncbi:putative tRNA wybutosine-synthesizing protein [Rosellinia necatrix]|uniref:tRNA(Phe) 7-[(3-amino-3-carboxypropyl)-4-demethylwyosine(37)-N(4)]-methyltransferase n=1 Tax=Rosellinia necatrix TaxID=77044 RepID=A0A1S8A7Q7_ROSNE|nr:putative tRNA wybutosine-synthesizing protein [Rosellinia necatrix]
MVRQTALPPPPANFARRKERILAQLAVPDAEYSDASPKGTVDAGIRGLLGAVNALDGLATTSSCAGRASVFVEGRKAAGAEAEAEVGDNDDDGGGGGAAAARPATLAAIGGKGGGGAWLFVSHDPVVVGAAEDPRDVLGLRGSGDGEIGAVGDTVEGGPKDIRLVHFKFEPMILHVLTASLEHAHLLLRAGLQAGFRESGAINVTAAAGEAVTPMVAIRSMGLSFESLVGVQEDGVTKCTVSDDYLRSLVRIANERFEENGKRIERFRSAILEASYPPKKKSDGTEWEDAQARRERKRAEGLRRKAELQGQNQNVEHMTEPGDADVDFPLNADFT